MHREGWGGVPMQFGAIIELRNIGQRLADALGKLLLQPAGKDLAQQSLADRQSHAAIDMIARRRALETETVYRAVEIAPVIERLHEQLVTGRHIVGELR